MVIHEIHPVPGTLEHVEKHVVHHDEGCCQHRHAPIAVGQEKGQSGIDMEVQLYKPASLVNEQGRKTHEGNAYEEARIGFPRCNPRENEAADSQRHTHHQSTDPASVYGCQYERYGQVGQKDNAQKPVGGVTTEIKKRPGLLHLLSEGEVWESAIPSIGQRPTDIYLMTGII